MRIQSWCEYYEIIANNIVQDDDFIASLGSHVTFYWAILYVFVFSRIILKELALVDESGAHPSNSHA